MEETKYYCDECGREVRYHKALAVTVLISQCYDCRPGKFDIRNWLKDGKWTYKEVYNRLVCSECIGEEFKPGFDGEGGRDLRLIDRARTFLVKHKFLRGG